VFHKTLIALAAAAALGSVPVATNALAAGHGHSRYVARYEGSHRTGPIYDSCVGYRPGYGPGYAYDGCASDRITLSPRLSRRPWTAGKDPLSR
jgi:hypothetical protein